MRAIGLTEFGGPEVLRVVDVPTPDPGPGEVRIRVHAVAVNPTDITFRSGRRAAQLSERRGPYIPGVDAAGILDALGPGADGRMAVGERVIAFVNPFGPTGGSYAEQIVVPESSIVPAPRGASFAEASTLLLNAVTAQLALDALTPTAAPILAVLGGAGAVGGYLIQLAKACGLTVLADTAPGDARLLLSLGAAVLVKRGDEVAKRIREVVTEGVPRLADCAALDTLAPGAIADDGGLATFGGWSGPTERRVAIHPISSFSAAGNTALFDRLRRQAEEGVISLRVADVLPPARAGDAHRRLAAGGVRGRIVLDFSQPL